MNPPNTAPPVATSTKPITSVVPAHLKPHPGQSDADIRAWMDAKFPGGYTLDTPGAYYHALTRSRPPRPGYGQDNGDWHDWHNSLTETQRSIAAMAKKVADHDPVKRAKRDKRNTAREAKRKEAQAADPVYQRQKQKQREEYEARIMQEQGRPVREYRKGGPRKTNAERNADASATIREALMEGRNPFPADKFAGREGEVKQATIHNHAAKHFICQHLLDTSEFDTTSQKLISEFARFATVSAPESEDLLNRALNALRAAKVTRRKGHSLHLHRDIEAALDETSRQNLLANNPNFGLF